MARALPPPGRSFSQVTGDFLEQIKDSTTFTRPNETPPLLQQLATQMMWHLEKQPEVVAASFPARDEKFSAV